MHIGGILALDTSCCALNPCCAVLCPQHIRYWQACCIRQLMFFNSPLHCSKDAPRQVGCRRKQAGVESAARNNLVPFLLLCHISTHLHHARATPCTHYSTEVKKWNARSQATATDNRARLRLLITLGFMLQKYCCCSHMHTHESSTKT